MNKVQLKEITDRYTALKHEDLSFRTTFNKPNKELWYKELLESSYETASSAMFALEARDAEIEADPARINMEYLTKRNAEYLAEGATRDIIIEALWEMVVEDRPEKATALQVIREKVKAKVVKP